MKRSGRLADIPPYLEKAEKAAARSSMAGLAYTKGLFYKY